MAILITVFQCDNCSEIASLKTDADWTVFEQTWWEGFKVQFCPNCRGKTETALRMLQDAEMILALTKSCEEKILNAEYIN